MDSRIGAAILVFASAVVGMPSAQGAPAAPASPGGGRAPAGPPAPAGRPPGAPQGGNNGAAAPQISQDAAARARMHECAHQWSSIKKAGNAGATTWKEFSATCLVVSK